MKRYSLYLPVLALIVLAALWLRHASGENATLQAALATKRSRNAPPPVDRAAVRARNNTTAPEETNEDLHDELRRIEEATDAIQKENATLRLKLPPTLDAEVTESYGRISDMGAEFGQYFRLRAPGFDEVQKEMKRRGIKFNELSDTIVKAFAKFTTWAPEIGAMEDTPAEIGRLQAAALREVFSLDAPQTKQAAAIIEEHFATMKTAGLTYSSREAPDWRVRRSESLTELLWKLRPLLPTNPKLAASLTQIVNLGAGIETKTIAPVPGTSAPQLIQTFPSWPSVPWLSTKSGR